MKRLFALTITSVVLLCNLQAASAMDFSSDNLIQEHHGRTYCSEAATNPGMKDNQEFKELAALQPKFSK